MPDLGALNISQRNLNLIVNDAMDLTNIYDFTFDQNYLTNHEYVCFLQQPYVRRGIHVGATQFGAGLDSYKELRTFVRSKLIKTMHSSQVRTYENESSSTMKCAS